MTGPMPGGGPIDAILDLDSIQRDYQVSEGFLGYATRTSVDSFV